MSPSLYVPPYGPKSSRWMIIGEAPGHTEYLQGRPFVGAAGQEQQSLLYRNGLLQSSFRLANIYPIFQPGNPDPTPEQIDQYTPDLIAEIHRTNPILIIAVGRISIRWFLGESAELDEVHGIPCPPGLYDPSRSSRAPSTCVILPVTHPAAAFYDETGHKREMIDYDYRRAAEAIRRLKLGEDLSDDYPIDHYLNWIEDYRDVGGRELISMIREAERNSPDLLAHLAIDTEKLERDNWIQVSWEPGTGYVLRSCQSDFNDGIRALQSLVFSSRSEIITHSADTPSGCLYDIGECRKMGLELRRARLFDTMYNLALYRGEPKGLKPAAYRFCGMRMTPYEDLLGSIGREKQIKYLESVLTHSSLWPGKERHLVYDNDGTSHFYSPDPITKTAEKILSDIASGKLDDDGNPTDPLKRWYGIAKKYKLGDHLRKPVEDRLGPMPIATLDDVPFAQAVRYAAIDPDATRRLSFKCKERNKREGLEETMRQAMLTIPHFEEMQWNGMPASKPKLEALRSQMQEKMDTFQTKLSLEYFGGEPFNPASPPQTAKLLKLRGLTPGKKSKLTNQHSTSKKSIEQYRYKDPAIGLLFDWREHLKIRSFCNIFLGEFIGPDLIQPIHPTLNIAKTETRRPSSEEPNLLNVPVRTEIGRAVRACFIAPEGYLMVGGDLSQIELRCLADDSESQLLIDIFRKDRDPHGDIGIRVFGTPKPPPDASKEEKDDWEFKVRLPAKTTNFGIVYGQQKYGLYEQFRTYGLDSYSIDDCENLRREILSLLGIDSYIKWATSEAKRTGCVRDISGMPHYLPNLFNRDDRLRSEAERQVISYRIQSMAQFMIQNSMSHFGPTIWSIQDAEIDVLQRLQVYDELICTAPEEYAPMVGALMIDSLENHSGVKLKVPVRAKSHIGKSWDELK